MQQGQPPRQGQQGAQAPQRDDQPQQGQPGGQQGGQQGRPQQPGQVQPTSTSRPPREVTFDDGDDDLDVPDFLK